MQCAPRASLNCMSEKTIRSGTSSGLSRARSAQPRISSHAASKSVDPPQLAPCSARTLDATLPAPSRCTHCGLDSKVMARLRKAGWDSSATTRPRPMAASIGVPTIDPETSISGTSLPRSTGFGSAARSAATASSGAPSPAASATAASRASAAAAIASLTPSRIASHCACIRSASRVDSSVRPPRMHFCAISCGYSCLPLTALAPFSRRALRRLCRAATRCSSSGWRLPVSSCAGASLPLSASLRKALRDRCRQRDETRVNSISAQRLAAISTSVVRRARLREATSLRYLRADAAAFLFPKRCVESRLARPSKAEPSRGAYLPARVRFGVRASFSAASSSAASLSSWSARSDSALSLTAASIPATPCMSR
mmetsp:Transcript_7220/g.21292  ORF Transcript_7220/g.21292 Transcript_7220/m.21292 type:complete len:370 (-) Transcript_7220:315-1424(-)